MTGSEDWLKLSEAERILARRLIVAANDFEPYPAFFEGARYILQSLVAKGVAEAGPSKRPAVAATGYRLTDKGWNIVMGGPPPAPIPLPSAPRPQSA